MGLALSAVVVAEIAGPRPPPGQRVAARPLSDRDGALHVAGSGTCLPLARVLVAAYRRRELGAPEAVVHGSIGSGGGLRALSDGVIDIAFAASPEQRLREAPEGTRLEPIAVAGVAVAVHPSVPERALENDGAVDALSGRRARWSDGSVVVPLLREVGDSATTAAEHVLPGLREAVAEARERDRYRVLLTDLDLAMALEHTPGAVGLYDAAAIHLEGRAIAVVTLDGVDPTREAVADGRYPIRRVLLIGLSERPSPEARAFFEFVLSDEGRAVIDGAGYVALGEGGTP